MLQPAITVVNGIEHEEVMFERRFLGYVPKANLRFADFLRIDQQLRTVKTGCGTSHNKAVGHTAGLEAAAPESTHLDRAVDQFVVVGGAVAAEAVLADFVRSQPGHQLPV